MYPFKIQPRAALVSFEAISQRLVSTWTAVEDICRTVVHWIMASINKPQSIFDKSRVRFQDKSVLLTPFEKPSLRHIEKGKMKLQCSWWKVLLMTADLIKSYSIHRLSRMIGYSALFNFLLNRIQDLWVNILTRMLLHWKITLLQKLEDYLKQ